MFNACPPSAGAMSSEDAAVGARERSGEVVLREADAADRPGLEQFIRRRYAEVYGAELYCFLPRLFGCRDRDGRLLAAFGLRAARQERLFLERYLDAPVEAVIAQATSTACARDDIAEIGNLAGATPGALRQLIPALTQLLHAQNHRWVVFTGSARLCNGFARLGLPLTALAPALPQRLLPQERERWGRYYEQAPTVMLGDVVGGQRLLAARTPRELQQVLAPIARLGAP